MAERSIRIILKNSDVVNRPYTGTTLLAGEPIVNTAEGVVLFSGVSSSTNEWTPSGPGAKANFFEVGSNLYDLSLRNRIIKYEGVSGAGLDGKILSGTTNGFILVDSNQTTSFKISGDTGAQSTIAGGDILKIFGGTAITTSGNSNDEIYISLDDTSVIPGNYGTASSTLNIDVDQQGRLTSVSEIPISITSSQVSDFSSSVKNVVFDPTNFIDSTTIDFTVTPGNNLKADVIKLPYTLTNGYGISTLSFDGSSNATISIDTGVTATLTDVQTLTNKILINPTISGATLQGTINTNLGINRIIYTDPSGNLTSNGGFTFDGQDTILPNNGSLKVGTGGLIVGSGGDVNTPGVGDVVIHGSLTVFGNTISASTSDLYIEDNRITLNYNPTTNTTISSLGSGVEIQDGAGISGSDIVLKLCELNTFDSTEYTSTTGANNRAFYTNLNDIIIRQSTDTTSPNSSTIGKRVLAEDDILDGGTY